MPEVLLFAQAREAVGASCVRVEARSVHAAVAELSERFGPHFAEVAAISKVWVNGEPAAPEDTLVDGDEVAVLPPVSGGAR